MSLPLFITAKEVTKYFKLTPEQIDSLEVAGHFFPKPEKNGARSVGVELFRSADAAALA